MILISENLIMLIAFGSIFIILAYFSLDMYKSKTGYNSKDVQWEEVIATTTGHIRIGQRKAMNKAKGCRSIVAEYTEYAINYEVDGKLYSNWFNLFPGPDFGDVFGDNTSVLIKYNVDDPNEIEVVSILDDSNIMMF